MKNPVWLKLLRPPDSWNIPVIIMLGTIVGILLYILNISKASSYLSNEPTTCVNCHIMAPQYATWAHSAHREVTQCNDCHVPHNNLLNKFYFKAKDGLRHATIFTLRREPQVIFIEQEGKEVVQTNCIRCHEQIITNPLMGSLHPDYVHQITERQCWDCHRETPHGSVNSLSSAPNARVPLPESPVPEWLNSILKND
jgi:cytochrome c nitrite reductase small subunit